MSLQGTLTYPLRALVGAALATAVVLGAGNAGAVAMGEPVEFESEAKERQYSRLVRELRCTVCQSETIYESNAPLAADMRRRVYEMTAEGRSEEEIIDFLVQRYGDYVRYRPPMQANTVLLWTSPFLALAVGGGIWFTVVRNRRALVTCRELTPEQRDAIRRFRTNEQEQ